MSHPDNAEFLEFDEANERHLAAAGHAVTPDDVTQVFLNDPVWVPNRKGRTATWLMAGYTDGGRAIVAAVVYDEIRRALRPITAHTCTPGEVSRWLT